MHLIQVIPAISEEGSGPSYSVVRLCEALIAAGESVDLAAMDIPPRPVGPSFLKLFPVGKGPRRLGRSPGMYRWLRAEASTNTFDVLHSHGMWQMNAVYPGWISREYRAPLVISPRGAFSSWAMFSGSPIKKLFWPVLQRPALSVAACFHATSLAESRDIRRLGFSQPVAYIPNAIDLPPVAIKTPQRTRKVLFLGRIHETKGVDTLLQAWARVSRRHSDWELDIVGTDRAYGASGGYLKQMKDLASSLRAARVAFLEPAYGAEKLVAYQRAELFVLPSRSESFAMTVAESLAAGTPAIVTNAAPWQGIDDRQAGWCIESGVEALSVALDFAMSQTPDLLASMGRNGRAWMAAEFSWPCIADRMRRTYHWLVHGGNVPHWVNCG